MRKNNQKGFSVPQLLLILVALGIIGGVGCYVYRANQDINKNLDTTVSSQNEAQKSEKKETNTEEDAAQPTETQYLEIKEYGVKVVLTEDIKDAYYVMDTYPYMSVRSLEKYPNCKMTSSNGGGSIAAVSKTKVGDDRFGSPWTKAELEEVSSLKIGEYYYWIELGNGGACSATDGQNPDPKEGKARKAFSDAKLEKL